MTSKNMMIVLSVVSLMIGQSYASGGDKEDLARRVVSSGAVSVLGYGIPVADFDAMLDGMSQPARDIFFKAALAISSELAAGGVITADDCDRYTCEAMIALRSNELSGDEAVTIFRLANGYRSRIEQGITFTPEQWRQAAIKIAESSNRKTMAAIRDMITADTATHAKMLEEHSIENASAVAAFEERLRKQGERIRNINSVSHLSVALAGFSDWDNQPAAKKFMKKLISSVVNPISEGLSELVRLKKMGLGVSGRIEQLLRDAYSLETFDDFLTLEKLILSDESMKAGQKTELTELCRRFAAGNNAFAVNFEQALEADTLRSSKVVSQSFVETLAAFSVQWNDLFAHLKQ